MSDQRFLGSLALRDGRRVQLEEYGDPSGIPAVWSHGGFSSRLEAWPLDAPARELGVRVIALDRPGCGGSDPHLERTVVGYADDVAQVLDALGIEQAAVGGLSNGGMYAMAVASRLPDRILRAVPYNSSTPIADAAAWQALGRSGRVAYRVMTRRAEPVSRQLMSGAPQGRVVRLLGRRGPDSAVLAEPATAARQAAVAAEARRQGDPRYLVTELAHLAAPWGFDHRAIAVPVAVVSGERDAGLGYARVWADELPQGRLVVVPGGHGGLPRPDVARRVVELLSGRP